MVLYEPYYSDVEFEIDRLEGIALCYQEERGQMVPMVGCVWLGPITEFWQPLEKVSAELVSEYLRRSSSAYFAFTSLMQAATAKPFVKNPPDSPEDDRVFVYPDLGAGVPSFPCVPTKKFTMAEAELAGWTQHMAHKEWGSDIIGLDLIEVCRVCVLLIEHGS